MTVIGRKAFLESDRPKETKRTVGRKLLCDRPLSFYQLFKELPFVLVSFALMFPKECDVT